MLALAAVTLCLAAAKPDVIVVFLDDVLAPLGVKERAGVLDTIESEGARARDISRPFIAAVRAGDSFGLPSEIPPAGWPAPLAADWTKGHRACHERLGRPHRDTASMRMGGDVECRKQLRDALLHRLLSLEKHDQSLEVSAAPSEGAPREQLPGKKQGRALEVDLVVHAYRYPGTAGRRIVRAKVPIEKLQGTVMSMVKSARSGDGEPYTYGFQTELPVAPTPGGGAALLAFPEAIDTAAPVSLPPDCKGALPASLDLQPVDEVTRRIAAHYARSVKGSPLATGGNWTCESLAIESQMDLGGQVSKVLELEVNCGERQVRVGVPLELTAVKGGPAARLSGDVIKRVYRSVCEGERARPALPAPSK